MLLTKIWTAILAILAAAFLGGMFLLAAADSGGFSDSDERAIRAVTQAGSAALAADIQSSPVSLGPSLLRDTRLRDALERSAEDLPEAPPDKPPKGEDLENEPLEQVFINVANETLLSEYPVMSVALVDGNRSIVANTGISEELFDELVAQPAFEDAMRSESDPLFSATLGGRLHAVKLSRKEIGTKARRVVAIREIDLGAGSFLRNVLGTSNPAGLVRDGKLLGETIGSADQAQLIALATENQADIPPDGVSRIFTVGKGRDSRIGAVGRVPGPAGKGKTGTLLVVLSDSTLGTTEKDLAASIAEARAVEDGLETTDIALLAALLLISLTLSFFLPRLEHTTPLRRLAGEFKGLANGTQTQIFHDTYGGVVGEVARSAVTAQEALRISWENEFAESEGEEIEGSDGEARPRTRRHRTRSTRSVRRTRGNRQASSRSRKIVDPSHAGDDGAADEATADTGVGPAPGPGGIDLPDAPAGAAFETHSQASSPTPGSVTEAVSELSESLAEELAGAGTGAPLGPGPEETPTLLPEPVPAPSADPREAYFREIYDEFVETKKNCGENLAGFTYEKFARKLRKNTTDLMKRPGTKDVKFTVYVKDGKAALKAKVVKT